MQTYHNKSFEEKTHKLKSLNRSLKELNASLKSKISDLQRSNKLRDDLMAADPAGIILIQKENILYINKIMLDQLGYIHDEVIGRKFTDFVSNDNNESSSHLLNNLNIGNKSHEQPEILLINHEGENLCFDARIGSMRVKGKKAIILNLTPADKRKNKERETLIRAKRDALSTMAVGLSHELDPCIKQAMDSVKNLRSLAVYDDGLDRNLRDLEHAVDKAQQISAELGLLSMEGTDTKDWKLINISEVVKEAVVSASPKWNDEPSEHGVMIDLKTYLRSSSNVEGDPEKIKKVIVNMICNSIEAMPKGGEIHLTTEDNAGHVHIYIQDTGEGISDQIRDKIFDPFFTTKGEAHKGLGLNICYSVIKKHKGNIEVTSSMERGAMFEIMIPFAGRMPKKNPNSAKRKIKNAQILIIQKEDFIRELMAQFLYNKGCRVDTAVSGLEGLGKIKKRKCDLVIADTELKDVNQESLIKKARMIEPKLPFVLIDGHTDELETMDPKRSIADLVITKPIDISSIVNQILKLLDKKD